MPAKKPTHAEMEAALPRLGAKYGHRESVTGWDIGYVWDNGKRTNTKSLRIHVTRKIDPSELESSQAFPDQFEGQPLDVIEGPYKPSKDAGHTNARDRFPVLVGGISCGRPGEGTGTLGGIVIEEHTGRPCVLSNWHVLAGHTARVGDPIIQPGAVDGGQHHKDVVAHLGASMLDADGDAAIAPLSDDRQWVPTILGDTRALSGQRDAKIGDVLRKAGRTTHRTEALVDGIGTYVLNYGGTRVAIDGFKMVPRTPTSEDREISATGDSGSWWYDPDTESAVGLHFAGETNPNPAAEHALACHMTRVVDRLGIRLAGISDLMKIVAAAETVAPLANLSRDVNLSLEDPRYYPVPNPVPQPWPWPWPTPIVGPWPTPFPWPGPFPWPYDPRLVRGGQDVFERGTAGMELAPAPLRRVSMVDFVAPNLRLALAEKGIKGAKKLDFKKPVKSHFALGHGAALAEVINDWPPFANDISPLALSFTMVGTYVHVLQVLVAEYERVGIKVV